MVGGIWWNRVSKSHLTASPWTTKVRNSVWKSRLLRQVQAWFCFHVAICPSHWGEKKMLWMVGEGELKKSVLDTTVRRSVREGYKGLVCISNLVGQVWITSLDDRDILLFLWVERKEVLTLNSTFVMLMLYFETIFDFHRTGSGLMSSVGEGKKSTFTCFPWQKSAHLWKDSSELDVVM